MNTPTVQICYTNRRGAGCIRQMPPGDELDAFLSRLRRPATIRNSRGDEIGEVWKEHRRWHWFYDQDAVTP